MTNELPKNMTPEEIDQRTVVVGSLLGTLLPQFPILGVDGAPLGLDSVIEPLEILLFFFGHGGPDLAGFRLLIEPPGDDHAGVLLEAVLAFRVGLVAGRYLSACLHCRQLVAAADDKIEQPFPHREFFRWREIT